MKKLFKYLFNYKHPIYKNWWVYLLGIILSLIFIIGVPVLIYEYYNIHVNNILWNAADILSFYAVILSGIITFLALSVTLSHNRNITNKQIKFNMAQTKLPFFIIENVIHPNSSEKFQKSENGTWVKYFFIEESTKLTGNDKSHIRILLKNVGDGLALAVNYKIDMLSETIYPCSPVIKSDSILEVNYCLQKNLDDKYINPSLINLRTQKWEHAFHTYLTMEYKNVFGVEFEQVIEINIQTIKNCEKIRVILNELSPQKIINLN